ncbi:MAG TPA: hypothetical protein VKS21_01160 [Spirochaetota bacterium]|nr:hypothetical protein [Spirochaetota bacterium]
MYSDNVYISKKLSRDELLAILYTLKNNNHTFPSLYKHYIFIKELNGKKIIHTIYNKKEVDRVAEQNNSSIYKALVWLEENKVNNIV